MPIQQVVRQFHDALDDIARLAEFVATAASLRVQSAKVFDLNQYGPAEKELIKRFMSSKVGSGSAVFQSLYVLVCAHFEHFVRAVHREAVIELNAKCTPFDKIKKAMADNHLVATGILMSRYLVDRRAAKVDAARYAANVGTCVPGTTAYKLNADVFSFFVQGASVEQIETLYSRIGLSIVWDRLHKQPKLVAFFGGGGAREIAKQSKEFIDRFVEERNSIVHRGEGDLLVTELMVKRAVEFFQPFSAAFAEMATEFCSKYDQKPN